MLIHRLLYHQPKQYTMKGKIPQFYHTFAAFDPRHKNANLNDHSYIETWGESLLLLCFGALLHTPLAPGNWKGKPFLAASPEHRSAAFRLHKLVPFAGGANRWLTPFGGEAKARCKSRHWNPPERAGRNYAPLMVQKTHPPIRWPFRAAGAGSKHSHNRPP